MGKHNHKGAKLLYKTSNGVFDTPSKTNSGLSLSPTKSGILHSRNKHPKNKYYIDNGKVKRDISIETDICILRGYYKNKIGRHKYSRNTTDVCVTDEFNYGSSACGDNVPERNIEKTHLHIDVTSLVVENLNDLMNNWVTKFLLDNKETRQKIDTVLDSVLHKLELPRDLESRNYTLEFKVDEKIRIHSYSGKYKDEDSTCIKQSCQTVPITGKHIRLISTLSIPTNMKSPVTDDTSLPQKIRFNNIFLTVSRSSIFLLNPSRLNLLNISTKSFTKRCATYGDKEFQSIGNEHNIIHSPKYSDCDNIPDTNYEEQIKQDFDNNFCSNVLEIEPMQSLVKSIYADDPANITSTENNLNKGINDNYTMTESDILNSSTHFRNLKWESTKISSNKPTTINNSTKTKKSQIDHEHSKYKQSKVNTFLQAHKNSRTKSKKKTQSMKFLHKKIDHFTMKSNSCQQKHKVLKDIQNILYLIAPYIDNNNIKFDIKVNLLLGLEHKTQNNNKHKTAMSTDRNKNVSTVYNIISKQTAPESQPVLNQKQSYTFDTSHSSAPKLISLLDSAVGQSKYVINKGRLPTDVENLVKEEIKVIQHLPNQEISKDISELRCIIKELADTTENFAKNQLEYIKRKKHYPSEVTNKGDSDKIHSLEQIRGRSHLKSSTVSKAIQFSNDKVKSQILSGLHLKKEPKNKDMVEFYSSSIKKSISYTIIESESILRVTDMTSAAVGLDSKNYNDKPLKRSLTKSKSQFEISTGQNKRKLLAYYCDEFIKARQLFQTPNNLTCSSNVCKYAKCRQIENDGTQLTKNKVNEETCKENEDREEILCREQIDQCNEDCNICGRGYSSSSVYIDVEDRSKKFIVRSRSGVGFCEGLIYCILLWIPVLVILWLIYLYVIKDIIQPTNPDMARIVLSSPNQRNKSFFHITLSDLGF